MNLTWKHIIVFFAVFCAFQCFAFETPKQQLSFKENKGQVSDQNYKPRPDILFYGSDGKLNFHLRKNGISCQLSRVDKWEKEDLTGKPNELRKKEADLVPAEMTFYRFDIDWLNANKNPVIKEGPALDGYDNYYLEVCPQGVTNVKSYRQITYENIYNGIDLKWYSKNGNLKYDYIVAPGADYNVIQLEVKGAEKISINDKGQLIIKTPLGEILEEAPFVTQNGKPISSAWKVKKNSISFDIKNVDPSVPLIIDPLTRLWGTYYGGENEEVEWNARFDAVGNSYMCGETKSSAAMSIASVGSHQFTYGGANNWGDAFVVKFNPGGVRQWGTYYGGAQNEWGASTDTDIAGNVYLVGATSSTNGAVIATPGSHQPVTSSPGIIVATLTRDAFLVKFDPNGVRIWGTYYGGEVYDWGYGVAVNNAGEVAIVGATGSSFSISTPGSHQPVFGGNGLTDGFLVKFSSLGVRLWATYYGGNSVRELPSWCEFDSGGNIYMYGMTNNSLPGNVIATPGSHQPSFGWGSWDAFLVRFDGNGVRQWGTFYGGSGTEWTGEIAVNGSDVYIAGSTSSSSSIATPSTHQPTLAGQDDAFLVKFDANGNRIWGTYYGGTQFEDPGGTAVDSQGNVYLTGASRSGGGTVIATPCTYQFIYAGAGDGFLAKFTPSCKRIWGTYYGGSGYDWAGSIDIDGMDNILIGGQTSTMSGPAIASSNGHQPGYGGGNDDAFLAKFSPCTTAVMPNTTPPPNMVICAGGTTQLTTTMSVCGLNWFDAPIDGNTIGTTTILTTPNLTVNTTFYIGDISCGTPDTLTPVEVTVHPLPNMSTIASSTVLCSGQLSTLTAQGAMTYTWLPVQVIGSVLTVTASSTTIYSVTGFDGNCFNSTTVTVESVPVATLNINSQANPACYGSTVALTASGAQTYSWYPPALFSAATGSLVYTAPIQSAVNYTIVGYNVSGAVTCSTQNTYSLSVLPQTIASISPSVEVCEGSKINLVAGGGNVYLWAGQNLENNNGPSIFASPSISSVYTTSVSNNNICPVTATVFVKVNPKPDVFAGNDTLIDLGDPVFISATGSGTLKWISGENIGCVDCPSTHVLPYTKSCYVVETTNDKGCKAQDDVCIEIRNDYGVYIPNTFTPNGDGINDIFYVYGFGIREYKMTIYDRWGIKLFVSTDQTQGWNGIYNGEICQQGTYIYYVEYIPYKGKHEIRPGHVNIIRGKP